MSHIKIKLYQQMISIINTDKDRELSKLFTIKNEIDKKTNTLNKILEYRKNYQKIENKKNLNIIPVLLKNRKDFLIKLDKTIESEKQGICELEEKKIEIISQINKIESKISALSIQLENTQYALKIKNENKETNKMDDFILNSKLDK